MAETYNGSYVDQTRTLLASTAITATVAGTTAVSIPPVKKGLAGVFDVTAAAAGVGDTLDMIIQTQVGSTWLDVIWFTQVLGNGGAKTYVANIETATALTEVDTIATALTATNARDIIGDEWRVRYVVAGGTAAFTASVVVCTY
jgi:hypothetical protein